MRVILIAAASALVWLSACLDVRDYQGTWRGSRVGAEGPLKVGFADEVQATFEVGEVDLNSLSGHLSTSDGLFDEAPVTTIPGAEADVLADIDLAGSPARVFLSFVETADSGGDAMAIVAFYPRDRLEVRILRGGTTPLYGIFALER